MEYRRFATAKERALLYYAADGKCQLCGCDLGDDFHADHIEPWSKTRRTNVHEMQALCPACNERKGAKMLRQHQRDIQKASRELAAERSHGGETPAIIAHVTPGGGKQGAAIIATRELIPRVADKVCWVVPRLALQYQAEQAFRDRFFRDLLPHTNEIRQSTNDFNPSRGLTGFATTYQAVTQGSNLLQQEFRRHRYLLVLDEPHHIEDGGVFHTALAPLVRSAAACLFMSGTLERGDGQRIGFMPYRDVGNGWELDLGRADGRWVVTYNRIDALREKAILPIYFTTGNARNVEWVTTDGTLCEAETLSGAEENASAALFTALSTGYATELLSRTVDHWQERRKINPGAKLLVVCTRQSDARRHIKQLHDMGIGAEIAISEDSEQALRNIKRFQKSSGTHPLDALVTVAMAYEGLDVPAITHIACLTNIRSKPWIEQMFARATRVDKRAGAWEDQAAYIFVPDDPLMNRLIEDIRAMQFPFIQQRESRQSSGEAIERTTNPIAPIGSVYAEEGSIEFGQTVERFDHVQTQRLVEIAKQANAGHLAPAQVAKIINAGQATTAVLDPPEQQTDTTPSERERALRTSIDATCKQIDLKAYDAEFGTTNKLLIRRFNKRRADMTELELLDVQAFLLRQYPDYAGGQP
jgi:superfamily II DNA or RNA helicase